jgi:IclR family transcriptional regulator, KDG regulon repressor
MNDMNVKEHRPRSSYAPRTFGKVLGLLECFSLQEPELSANEIGHRLGLTASTLYRYLQGMVQEGYIEQVPDTNKYAIGLHLIELGGIALSRLDVRRHGQTELDKLAQILTMNSNLGVLYHGDIFHLAFSVQTEVDRLHTVIGRRTPATSTAMGKTLLAQLTTEEVHEIVEFYGWRPRTPKAIQDFERLDIELETVRENGYATDQAESSSRTYCLGVPVFQQGGKAIAAMSVSTTAERFVSEFAVMLNNLLLHAEHLSFKLGYVGLR